MPPSNPSPDLIALHNSLTTLRSLLTSFQLTLQSPTQAHPPIKDSPNPLSLLSDASKLLKAQTTKLSLLILNRPFSPKEVTFILNALAKSVLPALMSGLELCPRERYTRVLHEHVRTALRVMWREMERLVEYVPEDGRGVQGEQEQEKEKSILASTGVLWEQCDAVIELGEKGVVWLLDKKVKGYGELLEDAIAELAGWDPDEDEDDDDDDGEDGDGNDGGAGRPVINTPTTSDEEKLGEGMAKMVLSSQAMLKVRVLKHLRLIKLLYPALRKWRIATYAAVSQEKDGPGTAQHVERLEQLVEHTQQFTEHADELAGFLYANAAADVDGRLRALAMEAVNCLYMVQYDWTGKEDEFSRWCTKWRARLEGLEGGVVKIS